MPQVVNKLVSESVSQQVSTSLEQAIKPVTALLILMLPYQDI